MSHANAYQKFEVVGRGSFGSVYRGVSLQDNQEVAIKIINLDKDEDDVYDVIQEINMLLQLRTPQIIRCYESFMVDTDMWLVMEFCAGGSCADLVRYVKALGEGPIAYILREALFGLRYLHRERKIHRDIKAANILLTGRGEVKLGDFGVSGQLTQTLTHKQTFVGTPYWMAPEVIGYKPRPGTDDSEDGEDGYREDEDDEDDEDEEGSSGGGNGMKRRRKGYNTKADIWSLGITAFELAEGSPPLSHLHPMKALWEIPHSTPPKLPRFQAGSGSPAYDPRNLAQYQQQAQAQQAAGGVYSGGGEQKKRRLGLLGSRRGGGGGLSGNDNGRPDIAGTALGSFGTSLFNGTWQSFSNSTDPILSCYIVGNKGGGSGHLSEGNRNNSGGSPAPYVAPHEYSAAFCQFVELCLCKDPRARPSCEQLLGSRFISGTMGSKGFSRGYREAAASAFDRSNSGGAGGGGSGGGSFGGGSSGMEDVGLLEAQKQAMAALIVRKGVAREVYNKKREERRRAKIREKEKEKERERERELAARKKKEREVAAATTAAVSAMAIQQQQRIARYGSPGGTGPVLQPLNVDEGGGGGRYPVKGYCGRGEVVGGNRGNEAGIQVPQYSGQKMLPTPPLAAAGHGRQGTQIELGAPVGMGMAGVAVVPAKSVESVEGSEGNGSAMDVDSYWEMMEDWEFPTDVKSGPMRNNNKMEVQLGYGGADTQALKKKPHFVAFERIMFEGLEKVAKRARSAGVKRAVGEMVHQMREWDASAHGVVGALVEEIMEGLLDGGFISRAV